MHRGRPQRGKHTTHAHRAFGTLLGSNPNGASKVAERRRGRVVWVLRPLASDDGESDSKLPMGEGKVDDA